MFASIKTLEGNTMLIEIDPSEKVADMKGKIREKYDISLESLQCCRFILCGNIMDNDRTIQSYNIQKETVIILVLEKTRTQETPTTTK